jgi:hypothetical protein
MSAPIADVAQHWHPCAGRCGVKLWCTGAVCHQGPWRCRACATLFEAGINPEGDPPAPWFRLAALGLLVVMVFGGCALGYMAWVVVAHIARAWAGT